MRPKTIVLIAAAVALLALVPPASAQGPISGTFTTGNGATGSFSGNYSGGPTGSFSGTTSLGDGNYSGPISGSFLTGTGSGTFSGTYSGTASNGVFSGSVVAASEPLAALVVGFGLVAALRLRRR